jgi:hypothetical protein
MTLSPFPDYPYPALARPQQLQQPHSTALCGVVSQPPVQQQQQQQQQQPGQPLPPPPPPPPQGRQLQQQLQHMGQEVAAEVWDWLASALGDS